MTETPHVISNGYHLSTSAWQCDPFSYGEPYAAPEWDSGHFHQSVDTSAFSSEFLSSAHRPKRAVSAQQEHHYLRQTQDPITGADYSSASACGGAQYSLCEPSASQGWAQQHLQPASIAHSHGSGQLDYASWTDAFTQTSPCRSGSFSSPSSATEHSEMAIPEPTSLFYVHKDKDGALAMHHLPPDGRPAFGGNLAASLSKAGYIYISADGSASRRPPMYVTATMSILHRKRWTGDI